jgi:two-component system sensor histidine kinase/response regulator
MIQATPIHQPMATLQTDISETILIIDDQKQNLQLLTTVLSALGHEVIAASSGRQAFELLEVHTPGLILLDVLMPEMNGIEVCRKIKEDARWKDLPVIFLSAADDKNLIVEALECGGVDYVTKPFNKAELLARVRTHLALRRAREELRHLAEDKDELLGILTHDFGNHLAGIHLNATVLERHLDAIPAADAPLIVNIARSTELMTAFVTEFLANQSAEQIHIGAEPFDLRTVLGEVAERYAVVAGAKKITLVVELPEHPIHACADEEALALVLDNLLSNAVKFSPIEKTVTLTAGAGPQELVHITIRDEGPGFIAGDQEKMFRRYARLSAWPTSGEPSTGLGLFIVKRLVEAMKGRIEVYSKGGEGASITVRLPAGT